MQLQILVPLLVCIVGGLVWLFQPARPPLQEMAKWSFIFGLFFTLAVFSHTTTTLGGR